MVDITRIDAKRVVFNVAYIAEWSDETRRGRRTDWRRARIEALKTGKPSFNTERACAVAQPRKVYISPGLEQEGQR
jgi:hypothetical protein